MRTWRLRSFERLPASTLAILLCPRLRICSWARLERRPLPTLSSLLWLTSRAISLTWPLRAGSVVGWVRELEDMIMLMMIMILFLIYMVMLTWIPRVEWVSALEERLSKSRESRGESRLEGREESELFCSISFLRDGVVTRREGER